MSYIILRGRWFHITVLNVHAPTEDKTDDVKDSFYEKLESIFGEEHKLRVFENRVLRIFGPKRDGVTGGWRKLYNEELHNLYSSPSIIRNIK
jgi:hypothetical protein